MIFSNLFSQYISSKWFFQICPNGGGGSTILRYIRTFDVIIEVIYVLVRRSWRFEDKSLYLSQHAICELLKRFPNTIGTFLMFRSFWWVFQKNLLGIFLKLCIFWALGKAPSFDFPVLFLVKALKWRAKKSQIQNYHVLTISVRNLW